MLKAVNELQNAARVPITDGGGYYTGTEVETALQEVGASGLFTGQLRTLHVNKHGNDSNSGDRIDESLLTLGAAITAAIALTPTQSAPVVIKITDAGVYQENISVPAWVRIDGPNAEVEGVGGGNAIELTTGSSIVLSRVEQANSGLNAIVRLDTTGDAWAVVGRIDLTGTANGVINLAIAQPGVLFLTADTINVDTGFGIGDVSNSTGHMHIDVGDIYISGNSGTAIARIGTNSTVGKIDHILESGTPTGTTAISVGNGTMNLFVGDLVADTSWSVALGATLNLHVNVATGTPSVTGTANVTESGVVNPHASSHAGAGGDPITSLGAVTFTGAIDFTAATVVNGLTDGNLLMTDTAGTDFGLLQFGGITASYPALRRDTTELQTILANSSAFAPFKASALTLEGAAPSITFTDVTSGDDDWSVGVDGDDFTINNLDSNDTGEIVLDHHINIFPTAATFPLPAFTSNEAMRHSATVNPGGAVNGYFVMRDFADVTLGGAFSSYGFVNERSTVTGNSTSGTVAAYVFVDEMTLTATLGNNPPVIHSFDHKPRLLSSVVTGACVEIAGLNDWVNVETTGTGQVTLDRWITVRATQFSPYYYHLKSSGVGSSCTVNNRIGFEMGEVEKQAGGGTETITNQYGWLQYAVSNVTALNVGAWYGALTGATENFGIVLDSDGSAGKANGGGGIWFGDGQDATIYYDASNLVIDPDVVGTGRVYIGATGDDDMLLNSIEIDADLDHDGSNIGFFGTALTTQQTVTGAKGGNVALTNLLTALAAYGLIVDSTT